MSPSRRPTALGPVSAVSAPTADDNSSLFEDGDDERTTVDSGPPLPTDQSDDLEARWEEQTRREGSSEQKIARPGSSGQGATRPPAARSHGKPKGAKNSGASSSQSTVRAKRPVRKPPRRRSQSSQAEEEITVRGDSLAEAAALHKASGLPEQTADDEVTEQAGEEMRRRLADIQRLQPVVDGTGEFSAEESTVDELTVDEQAKPLPPLSVVPPIPQSPQSNPRGKLRGQPAPARAHVPSAANGRLLIVAGNDNGRELELSGEPVVVGRGVACDLVLTDIAVSRKHLEIKFDGRFYRLRDLGSGNGTLLNDRVEDAITELRHGDRLELGNTIIRFEHSPSKARIASVGWGRTSSATDADDDDEISTIAGRQNPIRGPEDMPPAMHARRDGLVLPTLPPGANQPMADNLGQNLPIRAAGGRAATVPYPPSTLNGPPSELRARAGSFPVPGPAPAEHVRGAANANLVGGVGVSGGARAASSLLEQVGIATDSVSPLGRPSTELLGQYGSGTGGPQRGEANPNVLLPQPRSRLVVALLAGIVAVVVIGVIAMVARDDDPESLTAAGAAADQTAGPAITAAGNAKPAAGGTKPATGSTAIPKVQPAILKKTLTAATWGTDEVVLSARAGLRPPRRNDDGATAKSATKPSKATENSDAARGNSSSDTPTANTISQTSKTTSAPNKPKTAANRKNAKQKNSPARSTPRLKRRAGGLAKKKQKKRPKRVATRTRKGPSSAAARKKAMGLYRRKNFPAAAATLRAMADNLGAGAGKSAAATLRAAATNYETVGVNLARAREIESGNPTASMAAYRRALTLDKRVGNGAHSAFIRIKLGKVAPRAAASYMARKKYEAARSAADAAVNYGAGAHPTVRRVRAALKRTSASFYKRALSMRRSNPVGAKKMLQRILRMVPRDSPYYGKAYKLLSPKKK